MAQIPEVKEKMCALAPAWLQTMLETKFFAPCEDHLNIPRNECNMFCADCSENSSAFCIYCRGKNHENHHVIQIRRSSYHEVVRVSEVEELIDIKGVHTYVINSAKVFFLNERPQPKGIGAAAGKAAASPFFCEVCSRSLLYDFRFCSIGCKLTRIESNGDAMFVLGEHERNRVEGENAGRLTNASKGGDGSSVPKEARLPLPSLRPRHRNRKGIPRRAPFF